MQVLKSVFLFVCFRQAGHIELAERLVECQYELTDRLAFYLCGRRPGNMTTIFRISHGLSIAIDSQRRRIVVAFTHPLTSSLLFSDHKNGHYIIPQMADRYKSWHYLFPVSCMLWSIFYCFQLYTLESSYFLLLSRWAAFININVGIIWIQCRSSQPPSTSWTLSEWSNCEWVVNVPKYSVLSNVASWLWLSVRHHCDL